MWVVVSVVAVVVAVATYLTWLATRVDRLHARAAGALAALDIQSDRRARAAEELADREHLDDAGEAAAAVLAWLSRTPQERAASPDTRADVENRLTRVLRLVATKFDIDALTDVAETSRRLALARQLHSDLVRDALAVRRRPLVRLLRLSNRHPRPEFFDIDDPALTP
jgi:hypothetical protein